ncbi:MAG: VWA domain-containing protein [Pseudomonadota bacterium]
MAVSRNGAAAGRHGKARVTDARFWGAVLCLAIAFGCDPSNQAAPDAATVDAGTDANRDRCLDPTSDRDFDYIFDGDEGAPSRDTDSDGTPDCEDTDSDNDGLDDAVEAGDTDPCSPPLDSDRDGVPDFRSSDSDANGITDKTEGADDLDGDSIPNYRDPDDDGDRIDDTREIGTDTSTPLDSDRDGTPDYLDTESDGDGIPDELEGLRDDDGDETPAYRDLDADGDLISDAIEAGADPQNPANSDSDHAYDFLDVDSDNDGLADSQEDRNQDGVVDPGESNPRIQDTDEDGFLDVVEWAAHTDPGDDTSTLSADDFYFVLPYLGDGKSDVLHFSTSIVKADVLFQVDTTSSMMGAIYTLQQSLRAMVDLISVNVANVAMGVSWYKDFPVAPFGDYGDLPFMLAQRITTNIDDVQNGLNALYHSGGNDTEESGIEALYQAVTGEGIVWTTRQAGSVPKFDPWLGYDGSKGHGLLGGVGFRVGALPIVVQVTDAPDHLPYESDKDGGYAERSIQAHTREQTIAAAQAIGARFVGITSEPGQRLEFERMALATEAMVPPTAWAPTETQCRTGIGDKPTRPPDKDSGLCPLAFDMSEGGTGIDSPIVDAIKTLVTSATIDIAAVATSDPFLLPDIDTGLFVESIVPVEPPPRGSKIEGDTFRNVMPGDDVQFRVFARNTTVPQRREAQLFTVAIRVLGDNVTELDRRDVFIVVPGGGVD